jgi:hypothetical protein
MAARLFSMLGGLCVLASCAFAAPDATMIVDTQFDQLGNTVLATAAAPVYEAELPLKAPTKIVSNPASSISGAPEPEGEWTPPFAKVILTPDHQPPASALIEWDLKDLPTEAGRYLATFDVLVLDGSADSGIFVVGLLDQEARSFVSSAAVTYPFVSIINKEIGSAKRQRLQVGIPYRIEILVDTQKNTWSSTINGEVVREEQPFSGKVSEQAPAGFRLGKLAYATAVPGFFACKPGGSLAIKRVTLKKLPGE